MSPPHALPSLGDHCPDSRRVDGPHHSWVFDGDDPWIVCAFCGERRSTTQVAVNALQPHDKRGAEGQAGGGNQRPANTLQGQSSSHLRRTVTNSARLIDGSVWITAPQGWWVQVL